MAYLDNTGLSYFWGKIKSALSSKQNKITASGILKGDGAGGITAAKAGTDYADVLSSIARQTKKTMKAVRLRLHRAKHMMRFATRFWNRSGVMRNMTGYITRWRKSL